MRDFSFNGVSLSSFGGRIIQTPAHTIATRDKTFTKIYGQSGDELIDNGSYNNVTFSVEIGFFTFVSQQTAQQLASAIIDWLAPLQNGYYQYRDTENEGYFTQAALVNFDQVQREMHTFLKTTLTFNRVPFWYSDNGIVEQDLIGGGVAHTIENPENYDAEPLYKFIYWRSGTTETAQITINGVLTEFPLETAGATYYLDNVSKQFYRIVDGSKIYLGATLLPNLVPGNNTITYVLNTISSGSFSMKITPNWRRL